MPVGRFKSAARLFEFHLRVSEKEMDASTAG
jgi:hypothetical protein